MRARAEERNTRERREAVVIGGSLGAVQALQGLLPQLPPHYALPVIVVLHQHRHAGDLASRRLAECCKLPVVPIEDKAAIAPSYVYVCPPNYHVLVDGARTFALSIEPPVHFARPSIDVLFESAAGVYGSRLVGVLLSGASADGAAGLQHIQALGGAVFCQSPESALEPTMPRAGQARVRVDRVASPELLGLELSELCP